MKPQDQKTESFKKAMAQRDPVDEAKFYDDSEDVDIGGEEELDEESIAEEMEDDEIIEEEDYSGDEN